MSENTTPVQAGTESQREWVRRVLGFEFPPAGGAQKPMGLVEFAKLRLEWESAKKAVAADLDKLRKTIEDEYKDDPLLPAVTKLDRILAHFSAGLGDSLDDIANASDPADRGKAAVAAAGIAADYEAYLADDPLVDLIELNPFIDIVISGRQAEVLGRISAALKRIQ